MNGKKQKNKKNLETRPNAMAQVGQFLNICQIGIKNSKADVKPRAVVAHRLGLNTKY